MNIEARLDMYAARPNVSEKDIFQTIQRLLKEYPEVVREVYSQSKAAEIVSRYYTPRHGVSMLRIATELIRLMHVSDYDGYEPVFVRMFGEPYNSDGILDGSVFEKWLCAFLQNKSDSYLDKLEMRLMLESGCSGSLRRSEAL